MNAFYAAAAVARHGKMLLTEQQQQHWLRCCIVCLALLMAIPDFIVALKDVSVTIPQAVKRGSNALLVCNYDMENDTLYSVKWYKGRREFYRYTPKENPAMKVFAMTSGLNVERNLSNQSHVVLLAVPLNISGKFTCEISVEAPTFQTEMRSGEMEVVELPEQQAIVTGIQPRYRIGDLVDGNCSIKFSKPAANLTWTINGIVVPPHHIKTYQIEKYEDNNLESVVSALHFMVTTQHFIKGQMRLKCTASIFDIFKEEIESIIEEDRPRIMASGRSYDMNNYPYEQHSSGDGFEDHNESYLTYYSAADITSSAPAVTLPSLPHTLKKHLQHIWTIICASGQTVQSAVELLQRATLILQQNVKRSIQILALRNESSCADMPEYSASKALLAAITAPAASVLASTAAVSIILLTHHFISCQNRRTKSGAHCAGAQEALLSDAPSKVAKNVAQSSSSLSSSLSASSSSSTLALATATTTTTAKKTCRKSLYNCAAEKVPASAEALLTIPLQKLLQQQKQHCHCIAPTNQSGSTNASTGAASSSAVAHAGCQRQQREWRQLSVALADTNNALTASTAHEQSAALATSSSSTSTAAAPAKLECNFEKDVPKDQTLLMTHLVCHFVADDLAAIAAASPLRLPLQRQC